MIETSCGIGFLRVGVIYAKRWLIFSFLSEIWRKPHCIFWVDGQLCLYQDMEGKLGFLRIRLNH
ncbi:hypothetical protein EF405_09075 [Cyclobacteriaceae bacterium YHN15]|jgi:hypothetical protein|nr:hypothetical protein EF405_09075 [Cyclobacteriaceae bacterium YHN15]